MQEAKARVPAAAWEPSHFLRKAPADANVHKQLSPKELMVACHTRHPRAMNRIINGLFGVSPNTRQCSGSTIVFPLFLIELALFLGSSILILLVLGDEVIHVRL